jgi:threonine synthase
MKFYSTRNKSLRVSLREAVIQGLAPDNGLFMPETIPTLPSDFFQEMHSLSFQEIALTVAGNLLGDELPSDELKKIIDHTISFDAPLIAIEDDIYALELFHGPTLAFKDFGARFMSQLLGYFAGQDKREVTILVATSGDTGSAVANGFLGVPGTRVIVLYPSGKVSEVQEKQFTTLGKNITAIEVDGTFDDCQHLVKTAFMDDELKQRLFLTSANSINIARLIPQSFYYFYAWSRLSQSGKDVVFSVPSGNFGNLTAGLLAKQMGLPVKRFIAATNINDIVPKYLSTGNFTPASSQQTISNAMDVGNPSNFDRMVDLYGDTMKGVITGYSFTDEQTRSAMRRVFEASDYVLDPHGAIGYLGLKKYLSLHQNVVGVFLETAHPGKFIDVVEDALQRKIDLPPALQAFMKGEKKSIQMSKDFKSFKKFLTSLS